MSMVLADSEIVTLLALAILPPTEMEQSFPRVIATV
jgi:hypothetical protein